MLLCDFYKVSHMSQYPDKTEVIYSTWTPRKSRLEGVDKAVAFGFQYFIKEYLIDYFNKNFFRRSIIDVVYEYERVLKYTLGIEKPESQHIVDLHTLGYLPIKIKAVKEGTLVPMRVPMLTIENTDPRFFWLTNYLETLMSSELWQPSTSATIAHRYYKIGAQYADKTVGNRDHLPYQFHDFSFRGMEGLIGGANSGAGHLLSFVGTDTIPSILFHERYYGADIKNELVGTSIPATEHSVMCANADIETRDEYESYKRLITEVYPTGFFSVVSDTYDFWNIIGDVIPRLKNEILNRDGRVVIRPDSGDPVTILVGRNIPDYTNKEYINTLEDAKDYAYEKIMDRVRDETPHGEHGETDPIGEFKFQGKYYKMKLDIEWNRYDKQYYFIEESNIKSFVEFQPKLSDLGLVESLWNIFGGTVNELGYKVLDPHIGAIYGDAITPEKAIAIFEGLKEKGFASSNVVLGVGSFSYQFTTRDSLGYAMKATFAVVDGQEKLIFKDPATDDGTKRSQRGRVQVVQGEDGITFVDGLRMGESVRTVDLLEDVFVDGKLVREQTLSEIREILANQ